MDEKYKNLKIKPVGNTSGDYTVNTGEETFTVILSQDLFERHKCNCKEYKKNEHCIHIQAVADYIEKGEEHKENIIFLDVETRFSAEEVGGWNNIEKMKVAVVVIYTTKENKYEYYTEEKMEELTDKLKEADLIVGFNIKRFDYTVIQPYTDMDLTVLPTIDMLYDIYKKVGFRISLNALAKATLNVEKSADGLQSLEWFRRGELQKVIDYCIQDVKITRDLFLYGRKYGEVKFHHKKNNRIMKVNVDW